MANDYFVHSTPLDRHTLGRAEQVNGIFESVEAGFDKFPDLTVLAEERSTYVADTGAANAYLVALPIVPSAYNEGMNLVMKATNANTGASTINVNSLGVKTIKRYDGSALVAGDIAAGMLVFLGYDGTNFRIIGVHGSSETGATASAAAAATSEANAATSETNAATSATAAQTARTGAETAETNAETAETNAAASEAAAATSESNAATSESNAATSETNAATSESNASTSASNASTSASNAATSESNASTSASNAATSEANAATSETNAEAHYENFLGVYYGALASDPATDPNGDAVGEGDWYFNTTTNRARIYNGTSFDDLGTASLSTFIYTAAGGETSLSGTDDNGNALAYTAGFVQIFLNGARLTEGDDFTASNGTSITGLAALTTGDVVAIDAFSRFSVSDAVLTADLASEAAGKGAELVGKLNVDNIKALIDLPAQNDGFQIAVRAFYSDTDTGGGPFYWDASRDKADANGGTIIDPAQALADGFDGTYSTLAAYLAGQGTGAGTGCWVRPGVNYHYTSWFGWLSNGSDDDHPATQAAHDAAGIKGVVVYPAAPNYSKLLSTVKYYDFQTIIGTAWTTVQQDGGLIPAYEPEAKGTARTTFVRFFNLTVLNGDGTALSNETAIGIDLRDVSHFSLEDMRVRSWGRALAFGDTGLAGVLGGYYNSIQNCEIASNFIGLDAVSAGNTVRVIGGRIFSNRIGARTESLNDITFNTAFESNKIGALCKNATSSCNFTSRFEGNNRQLTSAITITRSGSTATVESVNHRFISGDEVVVEGADQAEYNGTHSITVVDKDTFTYAVSGSPATPATGSLDIRLREGGAIVFESGAQQNHVFGGHFSGGGDRVIDKDGRNYVFAVGSGFAPGASFDGVQLLSNNDFQTDSDADGIADGWTLSAALPAGLTFSLDGTDKLTGDFSQRMQVASGGTSRRDFRRKVRVTPGLVQVLAIRIKTDLDNGWNLRMGSSIGGTQYANTPIRSLDGWVVYSRSFVPTTDELFVELFMATDTATGTGVEQNLRIDAVSLTAGGYAPHPGQQSKTIAPPRTTAGRPSDPELYEMIFDTDLGHAIWFDGSNWVDATGTTV